jgi:hypothetical protein
LGSEDGGLAGQRSEAAYAWDVNMFGFANAWLALGQLRLQRSGIDRNAT